MDTGPLSIALFPVFAIFVLVKGISVVWLFVRRSPQRLKGLGVWLGCVALLALFGRFLYQLYWLDEPLYSAASQGDTTQVKTLLSAGASPNAQWKDGTSALQEAEFNGHKDIVLLLQKAGAKEYP